MSIFWSYKKEEESLSPIANLLSFFILKKGDFLVDRKENIELIINEGVDFLQNQIEALEVKTLTSNYEGYVNRYSSSSSSERILKMKEDEELKALAEDIINTFNKINSYFQESKNVFLSTNITLENIKDVLYDYTYMLANNLSIGDLKEDFIDWCENGTIYLNRVDEGILNKEQAEIEIKLMKYLANGLDEFTTKLADIIDVALENKEIQKEKIISKKDEALKEVEKNAFNLRFVSNILKDDKEVVEKALEKNSLSIQFASNRLKSDKKFLMKLEHGFGLAFKYFSKNLYSDREACLKAVREKGENLQYVSKELKKDKEIVETALKNSRLVFKVRT